ncbi:outer membrane protein assembly factor [Labilibaculum sp.]|uniref:BamA/OMP85 family outer membrane protein n=1 Tax=Labilibaculum sp. TaxID=2060723 RepID=UPI0035680EA8
MQQIRSFFLGIVILTGVLLNSSAQENAIVTKISFTGIDSLQKDVLLKQMSTKARPFTGKLSFWKKTARFSSFTFEEDLLKLKKYYQQNGFLDAAIAYELLPNKKNKKLAIQIKVRKGIPILYGDINYQLNNNSALVSFLDSLQTSISIKEGMPFQDEKVLFTENLLHEKFSQKGYPFVQVEKSIKLNEKEKLADITFSISLGNKSHFGAILLSGDSLIDKSYILKHIDLKKGNAFSQAKLEKTQESLFDMGLFKYVIIRAVMDSALHDPIPISIQVKELPRWSLKVGAGYGSEDKIRTSILLKRINFLGGGRTLLIKGERSYFTPIDIESKFIQPDVWGKNLDLIVNPYFSREREDSYEVDRLGTALTLQKQLTKKSSTSITYTFGKDKVDLTEDSSLTTDEEDELNTNKSGITLGYNLNTTNNLFSPTKGWKYEGSLTYMGIGLNSEYHYYKIISELNYFHPMGKKIVFANKLKGGIMKPTQGDLATPIEDRFLMGGALSLRGWGRNNISPTDDSGSQLGGNSMFEASSELRFPLFGIFSATAFVDFGNEWYSSWKLKLNDLKYDAGLGLRIQTPVGPIRLDVASPVFDGQFRTQFFITIGQAF